MFVLIQIHRKTKSLGQRTFSQGQLIIKSGETLPAFTAVSNVLYAAQTFEISCAVVLIAFALAAIEFTILAIILRPRVHKGHDTYLQVET